MSRGPTRYSTHYEKVRVDGRVQNLAILKAIALNPVGKRAVLGISVRFSEAEVHWRGFLENLHKRGLSGVKLIVSDDHAGLRATRRAVLPAIPWHRCQFHLSQNTQAFARRRQQRGEIAQALRDIFNCPTQADAEAILARHLEAFRDNNEALADWMEENRVEGFTVFAFPRSAHKRLRTINGLENLNKQIRRRTRVVEIFLNPASAERLITTVLSKIHEEWLTGRQYLNLAHWHEVENQTPNKKLQKNCCVANLTTAKRKVMLKEETRPFNNLWVSWKPHKIRL